jgi:hypothetical protein
MSLLLILRDFVYPSLFFFSKICRIIWGRSSWSFRCFHGNHFHLTS